MDLKALATNALGAVNTAPNYGADINANGSNNAALANIRALAALSAQGDAAARISGGMGTAAGQQAENEDQTRRAKAAAEDDEMQKKAKELERLQDPDEYKAIINKVGGYDFFDPLGNKISPTKYASVKNLQMTDVFKNSQDPADEDFVEDYKRVTQLGKILQSGDKKKRDKFYKDNPDWKDAYGDTPFNEIVKDLHNEYPGYFRSAEENQRKEIKRSTPNSIGGGGGNILQRLVSGLLG